MNEVFDMEKAVLGFIIEKPSLITETLERLPPEEWSGPNQAIAETLLGMADLQVEVTPVTVMERLRAAGLLNRVGGAAYIHTLAAAGYHGASHHLIDALEGESLRRRARGVGTKLMQRADNVTIEPEEMIAEAQEDLEGITRTVGAVDTIGWPEGEEDIEEVWVIPNLLAEDERVMITGGEGFGKSVLIRQLIASVCVGRHPFTFAQFDAAPVLHIDLENPRHVSDRSYRRIRNGLIAEGIYVPDHLHRLEPRQFDVLNPRDVSWLMRAVRAIQPRLIAIGPLKNMCSEDLNEEKNAVKVCNVLNRIRAETRSALVVEAHAGHNSRGAEGDWRPRGSSSLLGWPEFGYGFKPISKKNPRSGELVQWRGARAEDRLWPETLVEGTSWPWVEGQPRS